jgi:BMFP domain-containing protein YqiC
MRHEVQKARERKAQLEARLTKIEASMYGTFVGQGLRLHGTADS